jgi:hypothetical protein
MAFTKLDANDKELIRQCMVAIAEGPYIYDEEFQTKLGITRFELKQVLAQWPQLDDKSKSSKTYLAINNCLNEVLNGVAIPPNDWIHWFDDSRESINQVYSRWTKLKGY